VTALPALAPSTWNCTLAIGALPDALALTVTVPDTVAPLAGAVIETVGDVAWVPPEPFELRPDEELEPLPHPATRRAAATATGQ